MSDDQPEHGISPIMLRFITWQNDPENLLKTDFDSFEVLENLQRLALQCELPDWAFDVVMALFLAAGESHPYFRLKLEKPTERGFDRINKLTAGIVSHEIADEIDTQIAGGAKQEAAVQEAMARHNLSRREVFRRLKNVREMRKAHQAYLTEFPDFPPFIVGVPKGYEIAPDGKLVPSVTHD